MFKLKLDVGTESLCMGLGKELMILACSIGFSNLREILEKAPFS